MFYLLKMALRNTLRNRRRSLLAAISVALALAFIVFMQGFIGGFLESLVKNTTRNETGHIRISTKEFREKSQFLPVTENLKNPNAIIEAIMKDKEIAPYIDIITPRITFGVLLSNKGNNKTALAIAGDLQKEKILTRLYGSIVEGRYIQNEKEMLIGSALATALKYKLGDTVKVMTQGSDFALHLKKFHIAGIFKTTLAMLDEKVFQIRLDDAQKLLRMDTAVQQIIIMLSDYKKSEEIATRMAATLNDTGIAVNPWSEISSSFEYIQMATGIYKWIYFIIALLGAFIIGNIMMMVVMERRHEIGILKSMGISRREILVLFLAEGMILGLVGSITGTALALTIISLVNIHGFDFTRIMQAFKGFPMDNVIFLKITMQSVLKSLLLGTFVSSLVSIPPSRRAATMHVVDSLKSL